MSRPVQVGSHHRQPSLRESHGLVQASHQETGGHRSQVVLLVGSSQERILDLECQGTDTILRSVCLGDTEKRKC